uniref:ADP-ribosylation factor-like protein 13B n=1 Tax=Gadus morhua TaxID=8049 RepID=A0A8C5CQS4_GADMO
MGQRVSQPEVRVLILGLDNAGKSSLLYKYKQKKRVATEPTIGFNVEMLEEKRDAPCRESASWFWSRSTSGSNSPWRTEATKEESQRVCA